MAKAKSKTTEQKTEMVFINNGIPKPEQKKDANGGYPFKALNGMIFSFKEQSDERYNAVTRKTENLKKVIYGSNACAIIQKEEKVPYINMRFLDELKLKLLAEYYNRKNPNGKYTPKDFA